HSLPRLDLPRDRTFAQRAEGQSARLLSSRRAEIERVLPSRLCRETPSPLPAEGASRPNPPPELAAWVGDRIKCGATAKPAARPGVAPPTEDRSATMDTLPHPRLLGDPIPPALLTGSEGPRR